MSLAAKGPCAGARSQQRGRDAPSGTKYEI